MKRPRPVQHHLNTSSTAHGLFARVREQQQLLAKVRSMLPPPLDRHCHAAVINHGRLLLYTDSPAWSSRLRFFPRQLDTRLRRKDLTFDSITVRVMPSAGSSLPKTRESRRLSAANAALLLTVADQIDDPLLSAALKRLGSHAR